MKDCDIQWSILANLPQVPNHLFFVIGVGDVDGLYQEARRFNARLIFVEFDVE